MTILTRREFFREIAPLPFLSPSDLLSFLASVNNSGYGFVIDKLLPARHNPDSKDTIIDNYQKGALLRYKTSSDLPPGWVEIVKDSNLHDPSKPLAQGNIFVEAQKLRPLKPPDFTPIHPGIPVENKRIEVSLTIPQTLRAYEGEKPFLETVITAGLNDWTPRGEFEISRLVIARYMQGPDYDLPGVPWVAYFTQKGHAFHGAYWRETFGRPGSHGCLNLKLPEAQKLWLWSKPGVRINIHD